MFGVSGFVNKVRSIAQRDLVYQTGGVGKKGICDCMGLVMGAMYELGHKKYDLHSTNYFARFQVTELHEVKKEKELFVGQLLFSARENTERLADRYKPGGEHYTGDLLDYYHVEVVTGTKPLEIIECTKYGNVNGIEISRKLGGKRYGAKLKDVLYDGYEEEGKPVITETTPQAALYMAVVSTNQTPLSVRKSPRTGTVVGTVPKGRIVEVLSDEVDGWPLIRSQELIGYASAEYLMRIGERIGTHEAAAQEGVVENVSEATPLVTIVDSAGNRFCPVGDYKTYIGGID